MRITRMRLGNTVRLRRTRAPTKDPDLDARRYTRRRSRSLANATLTVWSYLLDPAFLKGFYDRHRGRGYEDILTFPTVVALTRDALILHRGSALPAIERADERGEMPTCQEAYYAKLRRIRPELSEAFLGEAAQRLAALRPPRPGDRALPASLDGLEVIDLDGKQIKGVAKRLGPARGRPGKVIGGKVLVAYLPRTGSAVAMAAERDGEANDIRLMPRAVPLARARTVGPRLWVADRQFCDLDQPALLSEGGDHFLLRRSLSLGFAADPGRPARESVDARGLRVIEQWGWIGAVRQGERRRYVRQVHLIRPGAEDVYLVTDLLDETTYPAADLLEAYLKRWEIEGVFQKIVEVFHLEHLNRKAINQRPRPKVKKARCSGAHTSVQKLLDAKRKKREESKSGP